MAMSNPAVHQRALDIGLTALAPLLWGSTYIVTTELLPPDRPLVAACLRTLPAGLLLLLWVRQWPAPGEWLRLLVLAGLNLALFQALLFVAAYRLPGGVAAVVGAIQPLLVMGLAWAWDVRRPNPVAVLASVVGIVGMALLLLSPQSRWDVAGVLAALIGAASMATGTYLSRRWKSSLSLLGFTAWQLMLAGLMLLPAAWWLDPPLQALSLGAGLGYAYLSLAGALLAYVLWFRGLARLSPVAVSALGLLSPVTAVLLGWALLGQALHGAALWGLMLVLGSVLVVQKAPSPPRPVA
ncbi:MAG: EamA family transporter [Roseateles asaccharophilus]|uniref:Putative blue pigment (Indigoidine) exporter n=1 Tax=Roseateles asaccharophilus TaxID=582607 RepID=A0A4R6NAL2_9BURK|nr:putative blue pigment (indigoidine) exporter [Roseateles asaccharophilus]